MTRRSFILLLLVSVPFLTTQARNNWYLPPSNTGHYMVAASKANVVRGPAVRAPQLVVAVAIPAPPQLEIEGAHRIEFSPSFASTGLAVLVQRGPPSTFSVR